MRILGVDEAGRGCVIGPLVIAGVLLDECKQHKLVELGVKDSKCLQRRRREFLALQIRKLAADIHIVKLTPKEIDKVVNSKRRLHKLNRLEAKGMAKIIATLKPDLAIVDASDVLENRYKKHIEEELSFPLQLISEHKADSNYPIVSAASIIAKVERDSIIDKLKVQHGDFGSGYTSDPKTIIFLEKLIRKTGCYPDFIRASWKPAKRTKNNAKLVQIKL